MVDISKKHCCGIKSQYILFEHKCFDRNPALNSNYDEYVTVSQRGIYLSFRKYLITHEVINISLFCYGLAVEFYASELAQNVSGRI